MSRRRDDLFTDAAERFSPRERGRFGDNESRAIRGNESVRSDLVDLTLQLRAQSDKAIGVGEAGSTRPPIWLPKSQIEWRVVKADVIEVTLPEWLAKSKGLI